MKTLRTVALLLLLAAPAGAANTIVCWKVFPLSPCIKFLVGDTEAGLPSGSTEGVVAYANDTDRLVCWSGAAWAECNTGGGGGVTDGDKGDITVASSGASWTIDAAAVSADELDEAGVEAGLEAVLDLADLQGAVTDGQVPNDITVNLSATASELAADPPPCSSGLFVNDVDADGTLHCGTPSGSSLSLDLDADGGTDSSALTKIAARSNYERWGASEGTADVLTLDQKAATDQALAFKPGSADTPDDDFNSTTLDAKWSTARCSGCASGTVSLLEMGDVEEYDLTSTPGWLLVATGSTSAQSCCFGQTYTIPDGKSIVTKAAMAQFPATNNAHQYGINLCDDSSCTNLIQVFIDQDLNAHRCFASETGTATGVLTSAYVDAAFFYLRIARDGLNYHTFCSTNGVTWTHLGYATAAAAATYFEIFSGSSATQSSSYTVPISAFDWVRLGTNGLNPW